MRIVSLLPAATEWVCALGAEEHLVGRSHACNYPPSVASLPVLTQSAVTGGGTDDINRQVSETLQKGLSIYEVNLERLRSVDPDLIITQAQCEVCAVSLPQLEQLLQDWSGQRPELLSMEPMTLKQVLDAGLRIGRMVGRFEEAMRLLGASEKKLQVLRSRLGLDRSGRTLPSVACVEWMDPLMTAGHWMSDVAEMAGGRAVLSDKGRPSERVPWEALREEDPDVIAVMPCGFSVPDIVQELPSLLEQEEWSDLQAVRQERVYLLDGSAYFNRPGPRIYRSIELLAAALNPEKGGAYVKPEEWEMINLAEIGRW